MQLAKCTWNGKTVNSGWVTTFSKRTIVSEDRVTPTPKGTSFELAALMGCAVTTALGLINKDAKLKTGQSIAVFGCGAVGLNVVQVATIVSANPIIAVDIRDSKLGFARKLGATRTLNPRPLTCAGGSAKSKLSSRTPAMLKWLDSPTDLPCRKAAQLTEARYYNVILRNAVQLK